MKDPQNKSLQHTLQFMEQLRYIAHQGLHYQTGDRHDQARYEELLALSAQHYAPVLDLPAPEILKQFQQELGHMTPKSGVSGALFNATGHIFLVKRKDDYRWSLPCGWCDVNETPEQALQREFKEEVNLDVHIDQLVHVFTRLPGEYNALFTSYHMVYLCEVHSPQTVELEPSELVDSGWFTLSDYADSGHDADFWHREHRVFALKAQQMLLERSLKGSSS